MTNLQDPCTDASKTAKNKAKKHFYSLAVLVQLFFLFALISLPSPVRAGFFSVVSQLFASTDKTASVGNNFNSQNIPLLKADLSPNPQYGKGGGDVSIVGGDALVPENGPLGAAADISDQPLNQISLYVVRSGDTLSQVAKMYGVSVNTIVWANNLKSQTLSEGQTLVILPVSGVLYTIKKGDTLKSIAKKYSSDVNEIMQFNDIASDSDLVIGQTVTIPDAEIDTPVLPAHKVVIPSGNQPTEKLRDVGTINYIGYYAKPVVGIKTQGLHGYNAVDIGAPIGTPIWASADGVVIVSKMGGWNGGYGNYVVLQHNNNTQTLYAHMKETVVSVGEHVSQGQTIGYVGLTGKTTGPHVHFEVRGAVNPFQ